MNWDERYSEPGFAYGTAPNEGAMHLPQVQNQH